MDDFLFFVREIGNRSKSLESSSWWNLNGQNQRSINLKTPSGDRNESLVVSIILPFPFFFMAFMRVVLYNPRSIRTISAGLPPRINFISPLIILTRQSPFPVPLPVSFPLFFHPWLSVHRPPCDTRAIPITIPTMLFFSSHFPRSTRTISIHRVED